MLITNNWQFNVLWEINFWYFTQGFNHWLPQSKILIKLKNVTFVTWFQHIQRKADHFLFEKTAKIISIKKPSLLICFSTKNLKDKSIKWNYNDYWILHNKRWFYKFTQIHPLSLQSKFCYRELEHFLFE